jgi:hypothetical protein
MREHATSRSLPFIKSEKRFLEKGAYGTVTSEVVAVGKFKYKDFPHTNTVRYAVNKFAIHI